MKIFEVNIPTLPQPTSPAKFTTEMNGYRSSFQAQGDPHSEHTRDEEDSLTDSVNEKLPRAENHIPQHTPSCSLAPFRAEKRARYLHSAAHSPAHSERVRAARWPHSERVRASGPRSKMLCRGGSGRTMMETIFRRRGTCRPVRTMARFLKPWSTAAVRLTGR